MLIQNIDPGCTRLNHEGNDYEGKDGLFDLPPDLAAKMVGFPHWRYYDGNPWPHPKTAEERETEKLSAVVERVLASQAEVAPAPARRHPRKTRATQ